MLWQRMRIRKVAIIPSCLALHERKNKNVLLDFLHHSIPLDEAFPEVSDQKLLHGPKLTALFGVN